MNLQLGAYRAILKEEDGGFLAMVPALRGCISEGETREEALNGLRDALEGWIKVAQKWGLEIPEPKMSDKLGEQTQSLNTSDWLRATNGMKVRAL